MVEFQESTLEEDGERYRLIFASCQDAMVVIDAAERRLVDANPAAGRLYGYSCRELIGMPFLQLSARPKRCESIIRRCLEEGRLDEVVLNRHRKKDGTVFPVEARFASFSLQGRRLLCAVLRDVTERHEAEEELRRNQTCLSLAIEAAGAGFYRYSLRPGEGFEKAHVSHLWSEIMGCSELEQEDFKKIFETWKERLHPEDRKRVLAEYEDFIQGRVQHRKSEYRIRHRSGDWRHLRVSALAVERDEDGRAQEIVGTEVDLTRQKKAEQALRESERRYRTLCNRTPAMMHSVDPQGRIIHVSDYWLEVMGYERDEVLGKPSSSFLAEASRRFAEEIAFPEFRKTGLLRDIPLRYVKKSGEVMEALVSAVMEWDEEGRPARSIAVLADVTERSRAERALRESERRYRELTDLLPMTVFECDLQGEITFINRAGAETFGIGEEAKCSGRIFELVAEQDRERAMSNFARRLRGEHLGSNEYLMQRRDGSSFPALAHTSRLIRDNRSAGVRGTVVDLSEHKAAEQERRRLQEQVLHAQKLESLGVLSGGIAHDFNNLLMGILGNASLALMELPADSPARPKIEALETAAQRAADLTRQLLAYTGKGKFVMQPLNLSELVLEMADLLKISVSKKAMLSSDPAWNLPPVEADPTQVRQIVMNLITNASDALGGEEGAIRISTGTAECSRKDLASPYLDDDLPEGRYVFLEVSDNGCGMDRSTKSRIFDPFFSTKFTGRGLGLAAVLGIVRAHRAAMQVKSRPGQGTTFRILFPALRAEPDQREPQQPAAPLDSASGRVLVVDDEEHVRRLAGEMLKRFGYSVLLARDGREALKVYRRRGEEISLVLLDMTMPRMDGEQTARELLRLDPQVRILLSSGYNKDDAGDLGRLGLAGFLQKPYRTQELIGKVQQAMGG